MITVESHEMVDIDESYDNQWKTGSQDSYKGRVV